MSREIKFRAWVPQFESYGEILDIHFSEEGLPEIIEVFVNGSNHHLNALEVILEQDTGLKDNNGKEIYVGDIVKAKIDGVWETSPSTIGFGKATWKLRCYWDEKRYALMWHIIGSKNCPDRVYDLYDYHISDAEVIGNIHENSELLGGETE